MDVYLVASNSTGGGGGPAGGRGRGAGAPDAPARRRGGRSRARRAAPDAVPDAAAAGRGDGVSANPAQRHFTMANLACYPAINVPNGFAANGQPTNVTFFARPFGETELLALAKAYQDAAGFHLRKPVKLT